VRGEASRTIFKVLGADELDKAPYARDQCLLWCDSDGIPDASADCAGIVSSLEVTHFPIDAPLVIDRISRIGVVAPGDVIRVLPGTERIHVLYRRGSTSNTLLATEQCNSFCLMCSQPPRNIDDRWLVNEMLATLPLVDRGEHQLGISGGEPTLLGDDLVAVLFEARRCLPETSLHILSNGRRFADPSFARTLSAVRHPHVCWGIPLYSDCPEIHDYIVQADGAWAETLAGLYNLAREGASVELRVVVQRANLDRLGELSHFIFRNLTFVRHVAFMGLEPIGFARRNRKEVWVDPADCANALLDAVFFLRARGIDASVYNFPLCVLPEDLWPHCARSISDWKNVYLEACDSCSVRARCGGFFQSVDQAWVGRTVAPIAAKPSDDVSTNITERPA